MRVYLAGQMSNIPQFNFPAFFDAATKLRRQGFDVVSPAELDDAEDASAALQSKDGKQNPDGTHEHTNKTWGDFLARDVKLLADGGIEGIVFLPGWEKSRGARLEATVGLLCGYSAFFDYIGGHAVVCPRWSVIDTLAYRFREEAK